jgi:hypothetical protein
MSDTGVDARPEDADGGSCRSCGRPIWWVTTSAGLPMPLDSRPTAEGNIEMVQGPAGWRAEQLAQVEALFDVQRPRWMPHFATCPHADSWRHRGTPARRL